MLGAHPVFDISLITPKMHGTGAEYYIVVTTWLPSTTPVNARATIDHHILKPSSLREDRSALLTQSEVLLGPH